MLKKSLGSPSRYQGYVPLIPIIHNFYEDHRANALSVNSSKQVRGKRNRRGHKGERRGRGVGGKTLGTLRDLGILAVKEINWKYWMMLLIPILRQQKNLCLKKILIDIF